ncbi:MAG: hypothetical protein KIT84_16175 [Labilithrix sp.]|nr:hypothetical protein [Labilithrix sp.]MCW5812566.1 hypothetical protein [Labilithrix sp.]
MHRAKGLEFHVVLASSEKQEPLRKQGWAKRASRRIDAVLDVATPLSVLARDPWWAEACARPAVVKFVVETLFDEKGHVFELEDAPWLARHPASAIASAWQDLCARAEAIALPASLSAFDALVAATTSNLGDHVAAHFRNELRATMQIDVGHDGANRGANRVLALGASRTAALLAVLRASSEPLHRDELARRVGIERIGNLPDEAIVFGRGTIGLREHFRDFDQWRARLVPAAVRIVEQLGPERQWHTSELLDELRESHDIPEWLTAYGLGALIKAGSELRYLGRFRVALPGSRENESRVYVHEALEELLVDAGEPVARGVLVTKLGSRLGASEIAIAQVFTRPQFVRVDRERIGLLARDVPGGASAIAEAAAHVEAVLARRERGLSEVHAHEEVRALSPDHARWTAELTMSGLRADGRFRFSTSGALGLATWESTRVPTRLELVRNSLAEAGGRVSAEAVLARIEAYYGDRPSRSGLLSLASNIQASVDGDWLSRRPEDTA